MTIQSVTNAARADMLHSEANAAQQLRAAHAQSVNSLHAPIQQFTQRLTRAQDAEGRIPLQFTHPMEYSKLVTQVNSEMQRFSVSTKSIVQDIVNTAKQRGTTMAHAQLEAAMPHGTRWRFTSPPASGGIPIPTRAINAINSYGNRTADVVTKMIREGVLIGRSPQDIQSSIYGALDRPLSSALTTSRTEAMQALRDAVKMGYQANGDIVVAWSWDARTGCCALCSASNGDQFALSESMDSHPNCQCVQKPIFRAWSNILSGAGIDYPDISELDY